MELPISKVKKLARWTAESAKTSSSFERTAFYLEMRFCEPSFILLFCLRRKHESLMCIKLPIAYFHSLYPMSIVSKTSLKNGEGDDSRLVGEAKEWWWKWRRKQLTVKRDVVSISVSMDQHFTCENNPIVTNYFGI